MKYTIHGFSQQEIVSINKETDIRITADELLLLRWFVDFQGTGQMKVIIMNGKPYYWVRNSKVIEDLPILTDKEDTIYRNYK